MNLKEKWSSYITDPIQIDLDASVYKLWLSGLSEEEVAAKRVTAWLSQAVEAESRSEPESDSDIESDDDDKKEDDKAAALKAVQDGKGKASAVATADRDARGQHDTSQIHNQSETDVHNVETTWTPERGEQERRLKQCLISDTQDQFRVFGMLEHFLKRPLVLRQHCYPQLSRRQQNIMIEGYYEFTPVFMRMILGQKLGSQTRKQLAAISSKTQVRLMSCQRQFDNLRRIFRFRTKPHPHLLSSLNSQEKARIPLLGSIGNEDGQMGVHDSGYGSTYGSGAGDADDGAIRMHGVAATVLYQGQFQFSLKLASKYARLVFLSRYQFDTVRRKLLACSYADFDHFAKVLLKEWVAPRPMPQLTVPPFTSTPGPPSAAASIRPHNSSHSKPLNGNAPHHQHSISSPLITSPVAASLLSPTSRPSPALTVMSAMTGSSPLNSPPLMTPPFAGNGVTLATVGESSPPAEVKTLLNQVQAASASAASASPSVATPPTISTPKPPVASPSVGPPADHTAASPSVPPAPSAVSSSAASTSAFAGPSIPVALSKSVSGPPLKFPSVITTDSAGAASLSVLSTDSNVVPEQSPTGASIAGAASLSNFSIVTTVSDSDEYFDTYKEQTISQAANSLPKHPHLSSILAGLHLTNDKNKEIGPSPQPSVSQGNSGHIRGSSIKKRDSLPQEKHAVRHHTPTRHDAHTHRHGRRRANKQGAAGRRGTRGSGSQDVTKASPLRKAVYPPESVSTVFRETATPGRSAEGSVLHPGPTSKPQPVSASAPTASRRILSPSLPVQSQAQVSEAAATRKNSTIIESTRSSTTAAVTRPTAALARPSAPMVLNLDEDAATDPHPIPPLLISPPATISSPPPAVFVERGTSVLSDSSPTVSNKPSFRKDGSSGYSASSGSDPGSTQMETHRLPVGGAPTVSNTILNANHLGLSPPLLRDRGETVSSGGSVEPLIGGALSRINTSEALEIDNSNLNSDGSTGGRTTTGAGVLSSRTHTKRSNRTTLTTSQQSNTQRSRSQQSQSASQSQRQSKHRRAATSGSTTTASRSGVGKFFSWLSSRVLRRSSDREADSPAGAGAETNRTERDRPSIDRPLSAKSNADEGESGPDTGDDTGKLRGRTMRSDGPEGDADDGDEDKKDTRHRQRSAPPLERKRSIDAAAVVDTLWVGDTMDFEFLDELRFLRENLSQDRKLLDEYAEIVGSLCNWSWIGQHCYP